MEHVSPHLISEYETLRNLKTNLGKRGMQIFTFISFFKKLREMNMKYTTGAPLCCYQRKMKEGVSHIHWQHSLKKNYKQELSSSKVLFFFFSVQLKIIYQSPCYIFCDGAGLLPSHILRNSWGIKKKQMKTHTPPHTHINLPRPTKQKPTKTHYICIFK